MTNERITSSNDVYVDPDDKRDNLKFLVGLGMIGVLSAFAVGASGKAIGEKWNAAEYVGRDMFTYSSGSPDTVCSTAIELATKHSISPDSVLSDCLAEESLLRELKLTDGTTVAVEIAQYPHTDEIDVKVIPLYSPENDD